MLRCFTYIFVQDAASLKLLESIGISAAAIGGDTRFDRVIKAAEHKDELPVIASFAAGSKILVAGSTWRDDEVFLRKTIDLLPADWKLILVPHEVNVEHLRQIEDLFAGNIIKWSQYPAVSDHKVNPTKPVTERVLLVDKVGFLLQVYRYGRIAWIGGGFGRAGVHNVLEAAVYGQPCFYGPVFQQFLEAVELTEQRGGFTYTTPQQFASAVAEMEASHAWKQYADAARNYVYSKSGATAIVLAYVEQLQLL